MGQSQIYDDVLRSEKHKNTVAIGKILQDILKTGSDEEKKMIMGMAQEADFQRIPESVVRQEFVQGKRPEATGQGLGAIQKHTRGSI